MPNWCLNRVDVTGDPALIRKFQKAVAGTRKNENKQFSFNRIIPMPVAYKKMASTALKKKYGAEDWYSWCVQNWGTKWDVTDDDDDDVLEDEEHEQTYGRLRYSFNTAWGPPKPICVKLRHMFPDLTIVWFYDEPGNADAGYL